MKCPWMPKVIINVEETGREIHTIRFGSHTTEFQDCIKEKCAAYFKDEGGEVCLRVEGGLK